MTQNIDVHTHVVPENFPPYAGSVRDVPWPSMAEAHACHRHVMISGKVYRTVSDGCWSVPRRIEDMNRMGVGCQALSPMPELLSYWLPLEDARVLIRYLNDQIAIRPMMYLALSYDHRLIDGREAVQFLVRVKECVESPAGMLLEI